MTVSDDTTTSVAAHRDRMDKTAERLQTSAFGELPPYEQAVELRDLADAYVAFTERHQQASAPHLRQLAYYAFTGLVNAKQGEPN
jgi:hypothetical protein